MLFIGCFEYGSKENLKLGAYFLNEGNTHFTVYPLIRQGGIANPPQLKDLPIVALDLRHAFDVSKTARKRGIYVVDSKAFTFRILTYYSGMADTFAILKYFPEGSRKLTPCDITEEIAKTLFPISFMFPEMLYTDGVVTPRTVSANPQANTDEMHLWFVFRSRISKLIRAAIDTKKGKHEFSVKTRVDPFLITKLKSSLPPGFPFRDCILDRKISLMVGQAARHDTYPRYMQECNVTDMFALSSIFGIGCAYAPVGFRVAHLTEAIASDARMLIYNSVRILYDPVNMELEVIYIFCNTVFTY